MEPVTIESLGDPTFIAASFAALFVWIVIGVASTGDLILPRGALEVWSWLGTVLGAGYGLAASVLDIPLLLVIPFVTAFLYIRIQMANFRRAERADVGLLSDGCRGAAYLVTSTGYLVVLGCALPVAVYVLWRM